MDRVRDTWPSEQRARKGVLTSRPVPGSKPPAPRRGIEPLGLAASRDGALYVPKKYDPNRPAPLLLLLHGAGGHAMQLIDPFVETSEARGYLLLSPESRARTWDLIVGGYGPDVAFINQALARVFQRFAIRSDRIGVSGFSDGASYALSLGLANGELFSDVLAFSPGFAGPSTSLDTPRIFISHGIHDGVLPIDACGRRLATRLRKSGYDVDYREFDGGHVIPPEMVTAAVARFLA